MTKPSQPSHQDPEAQITQEPQTRAVGARLPYTQVPNWLFDGNATPYELVVLMALQSYAPRIFPSLKRLARRANVSLSTVQRVLQDLEAKGYVEKRHAFSSNGSQTSSTYRLTVFDHRWSHMAQKEQEEAGDPWDQVLMREGVHHVQPPSQPRPAATRLLRGVVSQTKGVTQSRAEQRSDRPGGLVTQTRGAGHTDQLTRTRELDQENQKPKPQEPPFSSPHGGALPPVARFGHPDADGWMGGRPTAASGSQRPQEAASAACSGSPYQQAPQEGLTGPHSSQFQPEAPAEQPKPRAKAPAQPRDPYASRSLPESAIPDDLLGVQQELRDWWSVKPRGRSKAAFDVACRKLRRYTQQEQREMLETATIGGHQGLYEPASASARGLRSGGGGKPSLTQELRSMGLIK